MTKRVLHPTQEDSRWAAVEGPTSLHYLSRTLKHGLRLVYIGTPAISIYIDASFGVHIRISSTTLGYPNPYFSQDRNGEN